MAVAAEQPSAGPQAAGPSGASDVWGVVVQVLAAVGTGIGVLGFVAFFGGAVLWLRAKTVGLPPDEAVAVVSKSTLLATGASFLAPALVLALLLVAVLWLVHQVRVQQLEVRRASLAASVRRSAAQAEAAEARTTVAREGLEDPEQAGEKLAAVGVSTDQGGVAGAVDDLSTREAEKLERLAVARQEAKQFEQRERAGELGILIVALFVAELLVTGSVLSDLHWWQAVTTAAVSVVSSALAGIIYLRTGKFLAFAVAAFLSIALVIGWVTYYATINIPRTEAAAVLIEGREPALGFFVAQTSDRVYLGSRGPRGTGTPRLVAVPRDQVRAMAIGPLTARGSFLGTAASLGLDLCRQEVVTASQRPDGEVADAVPECSKEHQARLEELAAAAAS